MATSDTELREALNRVLDELSSEGLSEVLKFAVSLQQPPQEKSRLEIKTLPASSLRPLVDIVSWGGDALEDSERLWSED